ncbi:MAG: hypothetical protein AAGD34_17220 [Pseudomonadota bacterium]
MFRVLTIVLALASPAAAEEFTIFSYAEGDHFVQFGRDGSLGDLIVWSGEIQDEAGVRLGSDFGRCTRLDAAGNYLCNSIVNMEGRGRLVLNGVQLPEPAPSTFVIVAGTGDFAGATGSLISTPVENRARFRYEVSVDLSQ